MSLLRLGLAVPEQGRLAEMIKEIPTSLSYFCPSHLFSVADKHTEVGCCLHGAASAKGVRLIAGPSFVDGLTHMSVALVVVNRHDRAVDRNLVKVWTPQPDQLRIGVRLETRGSSAPGLPSYPWTGPSGSAAYTACSDRDTGPQTVLRVRFL